MCPKDKKKESGRKLDRDGEEEKGNKKKTARKYNQDEGEGNEPGNISREDNSVCACVCVRVYVCVEKYGKN